MLQVEKKNGLSSLTDVNATSVSFPLTDAETLIKETVKQRTYWDYYVDPSIPWHEHVVAGAALPVAAILSLGGCGYLNIVEYKDSCGDNDGDGYDDLTCGGDDCDDQDSSIHPGAGEICNGVDENCNGEIDEGVLQSLHPDIDGDDYGDSATTEEVCPDTIGYVEDGSDCDDADASINPGVAEICNEVDDNCDGHVDEGLTTSTYYQDADEDSYGNPNVIEQACALPSGYVENNDDCDDADPSVYPGAAEIPDDGIDQDCDGSDIITSTTVQCVEGDFDTIQEGIDAVEDGGTVQVCEGTYLEHLIVEKSVNIEGIGDVILDGNNEEENLVFAEGSYSIGFDNMNFTRGGTIFIYGASNITFANCSFYENSVATAPTYVDITILAALENEYGSPTVAVTDSTFFGNDCDSNSVCLAFDGPAAFENVVFEENSSELSIVATKNNLTVDNSRFYSNLIDNSFYASGTLYMSTSFGYETVITNSVFVDNIGDVASAIMLYGGQVTVDGCTIQDNSSDLNYPDDANIYGAVHLVNDGGFASELYSINTVWSSNNPYDVSIQNASDFYNFNAGSVTNFECNGYPGTCY